MRPGFCGNVPNFSAATVAFCRREPRIQGSGGFGSTYNELSRWTRLTVVCGCVPVLKHASPPKSDTSSEFSSSGESA